MIETTQYLKWTDRHGENCTLMTGNDGDIYYITSAEHVTIISREKLIQFAKMLEG
jgi:hypothetical protein